MKPVSSANRDYYDLHDTAQERSFTVMGGEWSVLLLLDEQGLWGLVKPADGIGSWAADLAFSRRAGERLLESLDEFAAFRMIGEQGEAA